jgi:methionine-S-sulfoxide reductase
METAIFAAGCFWGVQKKFDLTSGVLETNVGYTGGYSDNPSYEDVCFQDTGHAEAIEIKYDPKIISYKELLDIFWKMHNPTTLNRQGPDIGEQYRSAIFYVNENQKILAEESKKIMNEKIFSNKIVTEITEAKKFYSAEDYHQKYLKKLGKY